TSAVNSDLVVNSALLVGATQNPSPGFYLLRSDGLASTNAAVAEALKSRLDGRLAARIDTADRAIRPDQSRPGGGNLARPAGLDRLYAALIVAVGLAVFLLGSVIERQREFGTLQALGATAGQVTRLLLVEAVVLVAGGVVGGLAIGALLAWQYNSF